jgi:hypothetical protein
MINSKENMIQLSHDAVLDEDGIVEEAESNLAQENISKKIRFKVNKTVYRPKFESSIPPAITKQILESEHIPEIPQFSSSTIEDFIIQRVQNGANSEDEIIDAFFSESKLDDLDQIFLKANTILDRLDWNEIVNDNDIAGIKQKMISEMEDLKVPSKKIDVFRAIEVEFISEGGVSTVSKNAIKIDQLQIIRKALDYQLVDNSKPINDVIKALVVNVIAHEFGHQVQSITNAGFDMQHEWENDVPSERFAEGWARHIISQNDENSAIVKKSRVLQVAKVNQLWQSIKQADLDLRKIFNGIIERSDSKYKTFIEARYGLYGANAPENYALPYEFEQIQSELRKK